MYCLHPDLSQLRVFGCACYRYLRPCNTHKLEHRTKECLFLGYSPTSKGYLYLDIPTSHVYTSRHVLFNESLFPYFTHAHSTGSPFSSFCSSTDSLRLSNLLYLHSTNQPSILGAYSPSFSISLYSLILHILILLVVLLLHFLHLLILCVCPTSYILIPPMNPLLLGLIPLLLLSLVPH